MKRLLLLLVPLVLLVGCNSSELELERALVDDLRTKNESLRLQNKELQEKWNSLASPACTPDGIWFLEWDDDTQSWYFESNYIGQITYADSYDTQDDFITWTQEGNSITATVDNGFRDLVTVWEFEFYSECSVLDGEWKRNDGTSGKYGMSR